MKKKFTALVLLFAILLCGCADKGENDSDLVDVESTAEESEGVDTAYETIQRNESNGNASQMFAFEGDGYALSLKVPTEWDFKRGTDGYDVSRDGKGIGRLFVGKAQDLSSWKTLKTGTSTDKDISTQTYIERSGSGESADYRYRFEYSYDAGEQNRVATLTVPCAEVDSFAEKGLSMAALCVQLTTDARIGVLADNSVTRIAILGNSFISYSSIGSIINEMFTRNGKQCDADAISIGMATVKTYINDSSLMSQIKGGYYDMVFICGFYSSSEAENLKVLKSACDAGNTKLVIFPAHNENSSAVSFAQSACKDLVCLDWKGEINMLINKKKVSSEDFCFDDYYGHSKPLAGYVGAHMIYRAIYSKTPTADLYSSIDQGYVDSKLGDYCDTGYVEYFDTSTIKYLD